MFLPSTSMSRSDRACISTTARSIRQEVANPPSQLFLRKWLLNEGVGRPDCPRRQYPRRWKSRHIQHPDARPAPRDRVAELPSTETRHGDVGEDSIDSVCV